ncbi:MAG: hypothetical protein EPN40_13960 [Rhodanobacteraceae bacterium]|nr:MAG: hypothetical protein EPN40_13960 [Rhodanobacteraceae bacterium]
MDAPQNPVCFAIPREPATGDVDADSLRGLDGRAVELKDALAGQTCKGRILALCLAVVAAIAVVSLFMEAASRTGVSGAGKPVPPSILRDPCAPTVLARVASCRQGLRRAASAARNEGWLNESGDFPLGGKERALEPGLAAGAFRQNVLVIPKTTMALVITAAIVALGFIGIAALGEWGDARRDRWEAEKKAQARKT